MKPDLPSSLPPPIPGRVRARSRLKFVFAVVAVAFLMICSGLAVLGVILVINQPKQKSERHYAAYQREQQFQTADYASKPPPRLKDLEKETLGPKTDPPEIGTPGGVYTNAVSVKLKSPVKGGQVRYTIDGSDPTTNSSVYSGPIQIVGTTLLKARAFKDGVAPSPLVSESYFVADESVKEFSSNLPLLIMSASDSIVPHKYVESAARFMTTPAGQRTTLFSPADFQGRGEVRRRGHTSLRYPKMSMNFEILGKKASIFGLPAESDWILYAPYNDKTMMRDVFAYELSNKMGRYAPRTKYVEVFLTRFGKKVSQSDYVGVYVLMEKIKRGKNRVDIENLKPEHEQEPEITGGYIVKRDHTEPPRINPNGGRRVRVYDQNEDGFMTRRGLHLLYVDPKESEITAKQKEWLADYISDFEDALYGSNFANPKTGYAKYLDVDAFIDHFWLVELSKNIDAFRYSAFLHKDRGGKIHMGPAWDWNLSFGLPNYHDGWMTQDWYYELLRTSEICWFRRLVEDPAFEQRHIQRWQELRKDVLATDKLMKRIDQIAASLQEAQERNFDRWRIMGRHINPNSYNGSSYADEVNFMKSWLKKRMAWIDSQFPSRVSRDNRNRPTRVN